MKTLRDMFLVGQEPRAPDILCTGVTVIFVTLIAALGCGEKIPLPSGIIDDSGGRLVDTVYVPVTPTWTEADGIPFRHPWGITVGYDRTIYVCDSGNNRAVRLDGNGDLIESFSVPAPQAVAQDRGLNLVCVNQTDTIWLRRYLDHGGFEPVIVLDSVRTCDTTPKGSVICGWDHHRPASVAASLDAISWFFFSDDWSGKVYHFNLITPDPEVAVNTGTGAGEIYSATGVATWPTSDGYRLIVAQYGIYNGVVVLDGRSREPVITDQTADVYTHTLNDTKAVAVDELGRIYVLHRAAAEVMVFDRRGRFILSFGTSGSDADALLAPTGIAVLGETILIADAGNNRIVRYQMTAVPEN